MPRIAVENLNFSYGKRRIFADYSIVIPDAGIYTLTGPSGCGKTTLLRLLLGLLRPQSGSILVSEPPAAAFQEYRLFPHLSAAENVAVIRESTKSNKREILKNARALLLSFGFTEDETYALPDALSGGMKQRVSLARALYSESRILLLDEPSKELDAELRESLYEKLTERARSSIILLSTHRTEEIERLSAHSLSLSGLLHLGITEQKTEEAPKTSVSSAKKIENGENQG